MKNLLLFAFIIFSLINCKKKTKFIENEIQKNQIVIGQIDSIYSEILGESRELWIHIPERVKDVKSDKNKYPVLYLLDGPSKFNSVTGIVEHLSRNFIVPEMIIVGITNTNRTLDFTPPKAGHVTISKNGIQNPSGGGNSFFGFMEKELIPYIEKNYSASKYRTFVGHSLGGLSVVNALVNRQELFNNYIAIDPSLWWDNRAFLNLADSIISVEKFDNKALYVGVANTLETGIEPKLNIDKILNDDIPDTPSHFHIKSILQFVNSLDTKKDNKLQFDWKYYPKDNHGSIPLITEYDGLRFLFSWYELKNVKGLILEKSKLNTQEILNIINNHYAVASDKLGQEMKPPERLIKLIGNAFMSSKRPNKAKALFLLNINNYPKSTDAFETMGNCYIQLSDTLNAIKTFKKGLDIGENKALKEKLHKLINHN
ncbi:alpha/beta hydrolase-fold protein [Lutibacter agarilyticus]|nr:alpha/beta hydrolase-fold protein [Lutibacter agarilyticus]